MLKPNPFTRARACTLELGRVVYVNTPNTPSRDEIVRGVRGCIAARTAIWWSRARSLSRAH